MDIPAQAKVLIASRHNQMRGVRFLDVEMARRLYDTNHFIGDIIRNQTEIDTESSQSALRTGTFHKVNKITFGNGIRKEFNVNESQDGTSTVSYNHIRGSLMNVDETEEDNTRDS